MQQQQPMVPPRSDVASGQRRQDPEPRLDYSGRHRTEAELNRLNQEIKFLEEELKRLETLDPASVACKEFAMKIANAEDPFISRARSPANGAPPLNRWLDQSVETNQCCFPC